MQPNNEQQPSQQPQQGWSERPPQSAPYPPNTPTQPVINPYQQPQPPLVAEHPVKKSRPVVVISTIIIVMVVLFGGIILAAIVGKSMRSTKKVAPSDSEKVLPVANLSAYTLASNHSLSIVKDGKTVKTEQPPSGKTQFQTIAASDKAILVLATASSNDPDPAGLLVKSDGSDQLLTPSIAKNISARTSYSGAKGYLDQNNNFLSVSCRDTTCELDSLNLTSGATTPIMSQGFTAPTTANSNTTSLALLGVAANNTGYVITYLQNNSNDPAGTLVAISLSDGSTIKSLIMQKPAVGTPLFSPDFASALYTQSQDAATGNLIDWKTGSTTEVNGSIGNGPSYLWSPDSKRALFLNNPAGQTSTLGVIPATTPTQKILKTFPTSTATKLVILGWTDDQTIQYTLTTGPTSELHSLAIDSGKDTLLPASTTKTLLPVTSPLQST